MDIEERIQAGEAFIEKAQAHEPLGSLHKWYLDPTFRTITENYDNALDAFTEVLDVEPDNVPALDGFAYSLVKLVHYWNSVSFGGMSFLIRFKLGHYIASPEHKAILAESPRMHCDLSLPYKP